MFAYVLRRVLFGVPDGLVLEGTVQRIEQLVRLRWADVQRESITIYDTKGRFTVHRITGEEAEYKLGKVKRVQLGKGGIPFLVTHDART